MPSFAQTIPVAALVAAALVAAGPVPRQDGVSTTAQTQNQAQIQVTNQNCLCSLGGIMVPVEQAMANASNVDKCIFQGQPLSGALLANFLQYLQSKGNTIVLIIPSSSSPAGLTGNDLRLANLVKGAATGAPNVANSNSLPNVVSGTTSPVKNTVAAVDGSPSSVDGTLRTVGTMTNNAVAAVNPAVAATNNVVAAVNPAVAATNNVVAAVNPAVATTHNAVTAVNPAVAATNNAVSTAVAPIVAPAVGDVASVVASVAGIIPDATDNVVAPIVPIISGGSLPTVSVDNDDALRTANNVIATTNNVVTALNPAVASNTAVTAPALVNGALQTVGAATDNVVGAASLTCSDNNVPLDLSKVISDISTVVDKCTTSDGQVFTGNNLERLLNGLRLGVPLKTVLAGLSSSGTSSNGVTVSLGSNTAGSIPASNPVDLNRIIEPIVGDVGDLLGMPQVPSVPIPSVPVVTVPGATVPGATVPGATLSDPAQIPSPTLPDVTIPDVPALPDVTIPGVPALPDVGQTVDRVLPSTADPVDTEPVTGAVKPIVDGVDTIVDGLDDDLNADRVFTKPITHIGTTVSTTPTTCTEKSRQLQKKLQKKIDAANKKVKKLEAQLKKKCKVVQGASQSSRIAAGEDFRQLQVDAGADEENGVNANIEDRRSLDDLE